MLILPNTPPLPLQFRSSRGQSKLKANLLTLRASLQVPTLSNSNDTIRYAVILSDYLESIIRFASDSSNSTQLSQVLQYASEHEILSTGADIPWSNTTFSESHGRSVLGRNGGDKIKKVFLKAGGSGTPKAEYSWRLTNEIEMVIISLALIYIRIGSELSNEIIDNDEINPKEIPQYNEKWKQVVNFYKQAISYLLLGTQHLSNVSNSNMNDMMFSFIMKLAEICIQMSILSKSSWINRCNFNHTDTITTTNNGTLSRVAIYILNEIKSAQTMLQGLKSIEGIRLNFTSWGEYLSVIESYSSAYAGLFLSIENYQQDKLGNAIGLCHFSLVCLQGKKVSDKGTTKPFDKLRSKVNKRKNEHILNHLNSVSSLNINKSVFNDKSGIVLNDLVYLFDTLIRLNLKYEKENNNLKFDKVVNWMDINNDSKWPIGSKIPVSNVKPFVPQILQTATGTDTTVQNEYAGRGAYY
ncbi:uncharacterized protein J8A68_004530 [[Candida] subhashii]|uniref:Uncharacterized protein n=1 Tax=[Candida] subhashii TaxID=561895 RepID=A0A8J5QJF2_9ASCO|nr:uncharacterized protein J8A68_004530 [[Candida] subhashii]KAG7661927.1 hypothetical protein J8A68_004530 [[Candida] subhashii]